MKKLLKSCISVIVFAADIMLLGTILGAGIGAGVNSYRYVTKKAEPKLKGDSK